MKIKSFEKMTKYELLLFCLMAICSGVLIGIAGVASLYANSLYENYGKLIGALLFTVAIFIIVVFEFKLFTGMVSDIPTMGLKNTWRLAVCFICNTLGVLLVGIFSKYIGITQQITATGSVAISNKLIADKWWIKALCSSLLCGILITVSIKSVKYAPKKGLSATLGVVFPIVIFAFCGFDHSVANMLYFFYLGEISFKVIGYIMLTVLGNILGGVIIAYPLLLRDKTIETNKQ